jgi:hypothetical protein
MLYVVALAAGIPITALIIVVAIRFLRERGCATEINVIWYAFSLVFVTWWCLNFAVHQGLLKIPPPTTVERPSIRPDFANTATEEGEELRRALLPQWTRFAYEQAKEFLTGAKSELSLVAAILIVTIVPQLLSYIFAGLAGCAATPKLVWEFEKLAIWSLIKFLSAFGGVTVSDALSIYTFDLTDSEEIIGSLEDLVWGLGAVCLAFVIAALQVRTLEVADALGSTWRQTPKSLGFRLHEHFTRKIAKVEEKPDEEPEKEFDIGMVWDKLTSDQKAEVGALLVRTLVRRGRSWLGDEPDMINLSQDVPKDEVDEAFGIPIVWKKLSTDQKVELGAMILRTILRGSGQGTGSGEAGSTEARSTGT